MSSRAWRQQAKLLKSVEWSPWPSVGDIGFSHSATRPQRLHRGFTGGLRCLSGKYFQDTPLKL